MKKLLVAFLFFGNNLLVLSQTASVNIVPIPVSMTVKTGSFKVNSKTVIELTSGNTDASRVADFLSKAIAAPAGFKIPVVNKMTATNSIRFILLNPADKTLGNEGYKLSVAPTVVTVSANKPAGLFYGVQTIIQLLPKEIESKKL
jgi:hexosaminidase